MNNTDIIREQAAHFKAAVDNWCPACFAYESFENRLMRAFMHATAQTADQKRVMEGKRPMRPLEDYPDPFKVFPA